MYRRDESFRYSFIEPLKATITIPEINEKCGEIREGDIQVYNISPKGCSFSTSLKLPPTKDYTVQIDLIINQNDMELPGYIVWRKYRDNDYIYGFQLVENKEINTWITEEIKIFSKKTNSKSSTNRH